MRLSPSEIADIKKTVTRYDSAARVFLFGSRVNDNLSGGDIDLLIESKLLGFSDKISILADLKDLLGDQKIDILITPSVEKDKNPFIVLIRDEMVPL
jgi:predicted nucleotidyltransferase